MSDKAVGTTGGPVPEARKHFWLIDFFIRLVREKPMGTFGGVIVLMLLFVGIFADFLAPFGYNYINLKAILVPPSAGYILGTDNIGRDLLSRIIYGARISMFVGLGAATLDVLVATLIGLISGYFGGKVDLILQRFVDAVIVFPALFFYLAVMAIVGPGLLQVIFCIGILTGIGSSRLIRSAVMGAKQNVYVDAAKSIGASNARILIRHILPNVFAPVIIIFTIAMGAAIIAEASLSFLGFGIPPPIPSWGGMLSGPSRKYMVDAPWMAIWPGLALSLVVYGINMFGDALRDLLDPRLRGGVGGMGAYGSEKASKALAKRTEKSLRASVQKSE